MNNDPIAVLYRAARVPFVLAAFVLCSCASASYDAASERGADLSGRWQLNTTLSEDAEALLAERLEEEYRRYAQQRRQEERMRPPGMPPQIDVQRDVRRSEPRPWQKRRDEAHRRLLEISDTLAIEQSGARIDIVSAVSSRRLEAGSRSQVSMPQGELADSRVGWDGEWFVIERNVQRGPRVVERFRLIEAGSQLEYRIAVSGDSELSGLEVRRIYDRTAGAARAVRPAIGPSRQLP